MIDSSARRTHALEAAAPNLALCKFCLSFGIFYDLCASLDITLGNGSLYKVSEGVVIVIAIVRGIMASALGNEGRSDIGVVVEAFGHANRQAGNGHRLCWGHI